MSEPKITMRAASAKDAETLSDLNERTWLATYRGMLPGAALHQGIMEKRGWRSLLGRLEGRNADRDTRVYIAKYGKFDVGFAWCGPARDGKAPWSGELYMLYVLPEAQASGVGRALLGAAVRHLFSRGLFEPGAWCVAGNRLGHQFYKRTGGVQKLERSVIMSGARVPLVGFVWPNAADLAELAASVRPDGEEF